MSIAPATDTRATLKALLRKCRDDPGRFNSVFLRRPPYWWRQVELCESIARHHTTVAVSGNAIGKDYLIGGVVPWWLWTRPGSLAFVTGPSHTVLGTVTWKEIRKALASAVPIFPAKISGSAKASPLVVSLDHEIPGWGAIGYSTNSIERASGQHAGELLVVVEEASAADDETQEAIRGLNPSKLVLIGNPLRSTGWFRDLARRGLREKDDATIPAASKVNTVLIPSTDSPDIDATRSPRGLADRQFLEQAERDYGRDSLWWRSHVAALFPDSDTDKLIRAAWLDRAMDAGRAEKHPRKGPCRIAVDLGGGNQGDYSVLIARDDNAILAMEWSNTWTLEETAGRVSHYQRKYGVEPQRIVFDQGGIGIDFANRLRANGVVGAIGYMGGRSGGKRFSNLRSAAGWMLRMRLDPLTKDEKGALRPAFAIRPEWMARLRAELEAVEYTERDGTTAIMTKEALSEALGHSPDFADAAFMSWAYVS